MRYIGLDLGTKTLGIAISDRSATIASGYKTIVYKDEDALLLELNEIIISNNVDKIILGFPKNMNNTIGESAKRTLLFKDKLELYFGKEVILQDERLTTVQATNLLIEADLSRKKRKKVIDKLAATVILQSYLDMKK